MTVREAIRVLKDAKEIVIAYGDRTVPFDKDDFLAMDAYGSYVVDEISSGGACCTEGYYEIDIAMRPIKEGDNA